MLLVTIACSEGTAPRSGNNAPAISGNDINGEYFSLGKQKGKVVVLYFWSRKCCGDSLALLEPVQRTYGYRGLSIVGIESGGAPDEVLSFVKQRGISFVNLTDDHGMLTRAYQVVGFPTIFIVGPDGVVQRKVSGEIRPGQLKSLFLPLLPD